MDRRLFQAAHRGNTATLLQLLEEDPLILERVALAPVAETPLHVAALAGKTEFVSEILRLRPEFSKELNQDGFSPLHMASANGHVEVVKEMLKFGSDLCLVKDRDGRTPLHCAAIKGRVDVMIVLLLACAESAREVTARGETVLHLAVKNHQLEAFRVLVESFSHEWLLKAKDREGNTVFHLASFRRQNQVIELLLSKSIVSKVEINAKNAMGLTALDILDVLQQSRCELGDIEMVEILVRAGAMRSRDIIISPTPPPPPPPPHPSHIQIIYHKKSLWKEFSDEIFKELEDSASETRNSLMVVAVLIATVTFEAGISPPGGSWQDGLQENRSSTDHSEQMAHHAGEALMASQMTCFVSFIISNTVGFLMSLVIISLLTSKFPLKPWLRLAVVSMAITYGCSVCFVTPFYLWGWGVVFHSKLFVMTVVFFGAIASWKLWWLKKWAMIMHTRSNNNSSEQGHRTTFGQHLSRFIMSCTSHESRV